jgi:hypothetical protein
VRSAAISSARSSEPEVEENGAEEGMSPFGSPPAPKLTTDEEDARSLLSGDEADFVVAGSIFAMPSPCHHRSFVGSAY